MFVKLNLRKSNVNSHKMYSNVYLKKNIFIKIQKLTGVMNAYYKIA